MNTYTRRERLNNRGKTSNHQTEPQIKYREESTDKQRNENGKRDIPILCDLYQELDLRKEQSDKANTQRETFLFQPFLLLIFQPTVVENKQEEHETCKPEPC